APELGEHIRALEILLLELDDGRVVERRHEHVEGTLEARTLGVARREDVPAPVPQVLDEDPDALTRVGFQRDARIDLALANVPGAALQVLGQAHFEIVVIVAARRRHEQSEQHTPHELRALHPILRRSNESRSGALPPYRGPWPKRHGRRASEGSDPIALDEAVISRTRTEALHGRDFTRRVDSGLWSAALGSAALGGDSTLGNHAAIGRDPPLGDGPSVGQARRDPLACGP